MPQTKWLIENTHLFFSLEAGGQGANRIGSCGLLPVFSCGTRGKGVCFVRTLISIIRAPSWGPNTSQRSHLLIPSHWRSEFQPLKLWGQTLSLYRGKPEKWRSKRNRCALRHRINGNSDGLLLRFEDLDLPLTNHVTLGTLLTFFVPQQPRFLIYKILVPHRLILKIKWVNILFLVSSI